MQKYYLHYAQDLRRWNIHILLNISQLFFYDERYVFDTSLVLSDLHRRTDSFCRVQTSRVGRFILLSSSRYQAIVIFHSLDVPSIGLFLILFRIDIDDANSRFRRRYLPVVMYVREHNMAIVGKGNVIAYADFASSQSLYYYIFDKNRFRSSRTFA